MTYIRSCTRVLAVFASHCGAYIGRLALFLEKTRITVSPSLTPELPWSLLLSWLLASQVLPAAAISHLAPFSSRVVCVCALRVFTALQLVYSTVAALP